MLTEPTVDKLHEMRLRAMADAFRQQLANPSMSALSFEERFGMLVEAEYSKRRNSLMNRLATNAGLKINDACMEGIEYHPDRKLKKDLLSSLATCSYIRERRDVLIIGATGAGKTYIGCALGNAACRNYISVKLKWTQLSRQKIIVFLTRLKKNFDYLMVTFPAFPPE